MDDTADSMQPPWLLCDVTQLVIAEGLMWQLWWVITPSFLFFLLISMSLTAIASSCHPAWCITTITANSLHVTPPDCACVQFPFGILATPFWWQFRFSR